MKNNNKVILVVLDGLNAEVGHIFLGFLNSLIEHNKGARYTMKSELPAQSRPLYEVIQTGVPSHENGIFANTSSRLSKEESVYKIAKKNNLKTAASAYYWVSELYNHAPFDARKDVLQLNSKGYIDNGFFYFEDNCPDSHVIAMGEYMIDVLESDYTMIHTMNIDDAGHKFGSESKEYVGTAVKADCILSEFIVNWIEKGYNVIVTADHGMNKYHLHNGDQAPDRLVPFYLFSDKVKKGDFKDTIVPQLELAPFICKLLNIEKSEKMREVKTIKLEK